MTSHPMIGDPGIFISCHVPKTAGTAFRRHLESIFGDELCYDYMGQYGLTDVYRPTPLMRAHRLVRRIRLSARLRTELRPSDRCIHGHFAAAKYSAIFPHARYITWLRDPVERVASHYYHWKRNPDRSHTIAKLIHSRALSLSEFAQLDVMRNLQWRYLSGTSIQTYWFVGLQEHFDEMMPTLYEMLGEGMPAAVAQNRNPERASDAAYSLSTEERSLIESMNALDRSLYEEARELAVGRGWLR